MREREAFQEVDYRRMFGGMAKWVAEIDDAERIPEFVSRAFADGDVGPPGPGGAALPEDMLREKAGAADAAPWMPVEAHPAPAAADGAARRRMLRAAERPFVILGGIALERARRRCRCRRFAERFDLPVGCSFRRQDAVRQRRIRTMPAMSASASIRSSPHACSDADVLLLVGGAAWARCPSAGYTLIDIPEPRQKLVHVHPGAEELGRVYRPTLAIKPSPAAFAAALRRPARRRPRSPGATATRAAQCRVSLDWTSRAKMPGKVQMGEVMRLAARAPARRRDHLPTAPAIRRLGAPLLSATASYGTQLAPTSGSMGYGLPAAVAAKLRPSRARRSSASPATAAS